MYKMLSSIKKMEKPEYFNICVTILELKDLPDPNISSQVYIQIGSEKKYTRVVEQTDRPFFNEYFVFERNLKLSSLIETLISIKVFDPTKTFKRLIGSVVVEVATAWLQPDHRLNAWLIITTPEDMSGRAKGQVHCEITVKGSADQVSYPKMSSQLKEECLGKYLARYMMRVYDCVGLEAADNTDHVFDMTVKISFAGKLESTTERVRAEQIEWNEEICFIERHPPLFQIITIYLYCGKKLLASKCVFLADILHTTADECFGPSYIHLYVDEHVYCASICVAIEAEIAVLLKAEEKVLTVKTKAALSADKRRQKEIFLCYGVVYDAAIMDSTLAQPHVSIGVSIEHGQPYVGQGEEDVKFNNVSTSRYRPQLGNSDFIHLPLYEQKPCLFVHSEWPDTHYRLTNANIISNLILDLKDGVNNAQDMIHRHSEGGARKTLQQCVNKSKEALSLISNQTLTGLNSLDIKRKGKRKEQLKKALKEVSSIDGRRCNLQNLKKKYDSVIMMLDTVCEDVQESLPNVVISFNKGTENIGYCKVHPRHIFYSSNTLKRGSGCGKIMTLDILSKKSIVIGRVDIWLWLGSLNNVAACLRSLPPGHQDISSSTTLPTSLTYTSDDMYIAVCYIFGALIINDTDSSVMYNPSVRVFFCNKTRNTDVITRSVTPLWKETLIFREIKLYLSPEYIRDHPPVLSLELRDQTSKTPTLIGGTFVKPQVRLQPISTTDVEKELQFFQLDSGSKIFAGFEVIQLSNRHSIVGKMNERRMSSLIPKFIEPLTLSYRMEVVFWGVRPLHGERLRDLSAVQAVLHWGSGEVSSNIIKNVSSSPNFEHNLQITILELPDLKSYTLPILLHVMAASKFKGFDIDYNVDNYLYKFPSQDNWKALISTEKALDKSRRARRSTITKEMSDDEIPLLDRGVTRSSFEVEHTFLQRCGNLLLPFIDLWDQFLKTFYSIRPGRKIFKRKSQRKMSEVLSWWDKYYLSKIVKYDQELEKQPQFLGFNDVFKTFVVKKQEPGNIKVRPVAKLKAMVIIYQWPISESKVTLQGRDPEEGVLKQTKLPDKLKVLIRIYCIRAYNLQPCDTNGKSDPYIEIRTASKTLSDSTNYIANQLNPVFGKCFEITATLPVDSLLAVRVMDWDRFSFDDLIGETVIDIENRFYSKFRATCGLPSMYVSRGLETWRDIEAPTVILERLCNAYCLPPPKYFARSIFIGSKEFAVNHISREEDNRERLALFVLNHWNEMPIVGHPLVPEHVETRSLFNSNMPEIEQGKLEMWVDLFDLSLGPAPPAVNIHPKPPIQYELRVIIWETTEIPLVDNALFIFGQKHTDIYVKGWLGDADSTQTTDIHWGSTDGYGSFNYRFIFPFQFIKYENKMVIYKDKIEYKIPPILHLQVWDSDSLTADDFIGYMDLDLTCIPRGTKPTGCCKKPAAPVDLTEVKHLKGRWPFFPQDSDEKAHENAGFLKAEFQLLTKDEAVFKPAGLGRDAPGALPMPYRPQPLPFFNFDLWNMFLRKYKWKCITLLLAFLGCYLFLNVFMRFVNVYLFRV